MPPQNGPVCVECSIMRNVMASALGAELGGLLFQNCDKATAMRTYPAEMGHQQPPTKVAIDNKATNIIFNGTEEKNIF